MQQLIYFGIGFVLASVFWVWVFWKQSCKDIEKIDQMYFDLDNDIRNL